MKRLTILGLIEAPLWARWPLPGRHGHFKAVDPAYSAAVWHRGLLQVCCKCYRPFALSLGLHCQGRLLSKVAGRPEYHHDTHHYAALVRFDSLEDFLEHCPSDILESINDHYLKELFR